jgi:hypothetical protein
MKKEELVKILRNRYYQNLEEVADEILALDKEESLQEQISKLKHGEWYFISLTCMNDSQNWLIKFDNFEAYNYYALKGKCLNGVTKFISRGNMGNANTITSITPSTNEEVEKYFPDEFKPLFTTEDGVDVFLEIGQEFFTIGDNWTLSKTKITENNLGFDFVKYNSYMRKIFSTKEAAEEFIVENKPCLSYNEITNIMPWIVESKIKLKELVKSKFKS